MNRPLRMAVRFLALVALLTAISVLLSPAGTGSSPYSTALSDIAGTDAYASRPGNCNKSCNGATCERSSTSQRCVLVSGGGCRNFPC